MALKRQVAISAPVAVPHTETPPKHAVVLPLSFR
jgi:hypothetical protein